MVNLHPKVLMILFNMFIPNIYFCITKMEKEQLFF